MIEDGVLTVKELSSYLKASLSTVYRMVEAGEIPHVRAGRLGIRFRRQEVDEWLARNSSKPNALIENALKTDFALERYDRIFLSPNKGGLKMSPKGKTWNYPFGSVYLRQTKSGKERWYIYYRDQGKRVRKAVRGAQSRADALKVLQVEVSDSFRGKHGFKKPERKEDLLFEAFGKEFLELYSRVNRKPKTVQSHENSMKHLVGFFKSKRLSEITPEQVARYIAERRARVSASTVNRELSCLKCILNRAVEWGRLDTNPVRVKKLKEPEPKDRILTDEEIKRLLQAAAPHLRQVLMVLLGTAMRKNEALLLKWKDVDFRKGFIYVGAADSKSGRSRKIPMSSLVNEVLLSLRQGSKGEWVFSKPGTKTNLKSIRRSFATACREAGISGATLHSLRHSAASKMVESGIDLVTVKEILGHATIQMTMRYAHPTPENMRRAVETLVKNREFVPAVSPQAEGFPVSGLN